MIEGYSVEAHERTREAIRQCDTSRLEEELYVLLDPANDRIYALAAKGYKDWWIDMLTDELKSRGCL